MSQPIVIPYNERHEVFCPKCESLGTEYHPSERFGKCHECGFEWKFPPYRKLLDYTKRWPFSGGKRGQG